MPVKYPGRLLEKVGKKTETRSVKFTILASMYKKGNLIVPECQGSIFEAKVLEMKNQYKTNKSYFQHKKTITVAVLVEKKTRAKTYNTFYLLDGQHRTMMIQSLIDDPDFAVGDSDTVWITYHAIDSYNEIEDLYTDLNKDSYKNRDYVCKEVLDKVRWRDVKILLLRNKKSFAKTRSSRNKLKTVEEFMEDLEAIGLFTDKTPTEIIDCIKTFNELFYKAQYESLLETSKVVSQILYNSEKIAIHDHKIVYTTKQNNFVNFLSSNGQVSTKHRWKKGKKRITKAKRKQSWINEYGNESQGVCPVAKCSTVIYNTAFEAGHVTSEYNGGSTDVSNLRPICGECNRKMGTKNWDEYEKTIV